MLKWESRQESRTACDFSWDGLVMQEFPFSILLSALKILMAFTFRSHLEITVFISQWSDGQTSWLTQTVSLLKSMELYKIEFCFHLFTRFIILNTSKEVGGKRKENSFNKQNKTYFSVRGRTSEGRLDSLCSRRKEQLTFFPSWGKSKIDLISNKRDDSPTQEFPFFLNRGIFFLTRLPPSELQFLGRQNIKIKVSTTINAMRDMEFPLPAEILLSFQLPYLS